jgi:transposase
MKQIKAEHFSAEEFVKTCYGLDEFELLDLQFNREHLTLKIYARLPLDKCICDHCGGRFTEVHDWQDREARLPPFGNFLDVTLYLKKPRGHCGNCLKIQGSKIFFYIPDSHPWLVALQSIVQD